MVGLGIQILVFALMFVHLHILRILLLEIVKLNVHKDIGDILAIQPVCLNVKLDFLVLKAIVFAIKLQILHCHQEYLQIKIQDSFSLHAQQPPISTLEIETPKFV